MEAASKHSQQPAAEMTLPVTPQLAQAELPGKCQSPDGRTLNESLKRAGRDKYTSPAPALSSSMTPPPSSQAPHLTRVMRTPTPPTPHLSSPPPTSRNSAQIGPIEEVNPTLFSNEEIQNASTEELRTMANELSSALRDARMSSAHYKLQYNMLCIDSTEASNRMAVELAMAQREVDVLQQAEERRRSGKASLSQNSPESAINPTSAVLINEMNRQCQSLRHENDILRDMLDQSRKTAEHREAEFLAIAEENERLRKRIRTNREHINGYLDSVNDRSSSKSPVSPSHSTTPRHRSNGRGGLGINESGNRQNQQPFEALLLADKVLSQETATAPSTPTRSHPSRRFGHARGSHSLSSLPSTPQRHRATQPNSTLLSTPPNHTPFSVDLQTAPSRQHAQDHRRRESSDSTITASSVDAQDRLSDRDEVPESQASRAAISMLRRAGSQSNRSSETLSEKVRSSGLKQAKLFGQVRKPGSGKAIDQEKRRFSGREMFGSPTKRGKLDEGVGLGIGGIHGGARD